MYKEVQALQQTISMCNQLYMKNQFTTVILLLQPALPSQNLKLLELLAKSYLCLGFFKSCRQVSLIACNTIKASAMRDDRTLDLCGFLNLIILSEIELNMAIAKEHEEELQLLIKEKNSTSVAEELEKARDRKRKQNKINVEEVKAKFNQLLEKARKDQYMKEPGLPTYAVANSWLKSFEQGAIQPINSLELVERSQYLDLDKTFLHMNYIIKQDKQQTVDFTLLPKEPWDYLLSVFNGTQIRRMTTKIGDNVIVEVKYRTVKVMFLSAARMKVLQLPLPRTEAIKNIKNHLKRILIWHGILDKDSAMKENKLLVIKDMHDTNLLMKVIAAKKLAKNMKVIEINELYEFEEIELGPREFFIFEFLDKPGVSLFGANIIKQNIEGMDRCLTCCKKDTPVTLCECKTVSFCSPKCKTSNAKHAEACKKIIKQKNPIDSLLNTYNISKQVKLPTNFKASGKTGLQNIGNTCFMNSALQCIASMEDLSMYFLKNQHLPEINTKNPLGSEGRLACAYGQFLKQLFLQSRKAIEPRTLKRIIQKRNSQFSGYNQQDSQQFLSYFLDLLHQDLNRVKDKPAVDNIESDGRPDQVISKISLQNYNKRNKSVVTDLMVGQYKSQLHCPDCKRVSITFDPYMTVTLPLPNQKQSKVDLQAYPILLDGTIGKVAQKIPSNRLMSYFYELLGRKFCGAFISERKIKKCIESEDSVKTIAESNSSLFLYEIEEDANLEIQVTVVDQKNKDLTFGRRLKRKDVGSAERLKEVILLSFKKPFGDALGMNSPTDEQYLQLCEQKPFIDFQQIVNHGYPLAPGSTTKITIVIKSPIVSTVKLNSLGNYPVLPPQKLTIPYLLKNFSVPQQLTQDNAWYCNICKAHKLAKKKLYLYTTPKYLVMHLKRFSHKIHGRYVSNSKIDSTIKLSEYEMINGKKYELISMVNHMGSLSGGHYTATVKKNEWLCFDDDRIHYDKMSGEYAYLLFYRQVEPS